MSGPIRRIKKQNGQSCPMKSGRESGKSSGGGLSLSLDKTLGQHLLKNPGILDKIVDAAKINSTDTVLEIGPGTGNLTMRLLSVARQVIAMEVDKRMASEVKKRAHMAGRNNFKVIEGDAIKTPFPPLFDVCVANLPYQISSPFVFKLLAHKPKFKCAVVMFQKEFAERLVAQVGDENYGRLAVNTQLLCNVQRVCIVSRGSFNPPPEVDSMVVRFVPHKHSVDVSLSEFDGLLRICFNRKNRTLHSQFSTKHVISILYSNYKSLRSDEVPGGEKGFKDLLLEILKSTGLSDARASKIALEGYLSLLLSFNKQGMHFTNIATGKAGRHEDDVDMIGMEMVEDDEE